MASYSLSWSPKVIVQNQPPSSMKVAPMDCWTSKNADLLDAPVVDSLMGRTLAERPFRNQAGAPRRDGSLTNARHRTFSQTVVLLRRPPRREGRRARAG